MVGDSLRVSNFFPKNRRKVIARPGADPEFSPKNRKELTLKKIFFEKSKKVLDKLLKSGII